MRGRPTYTENFNEKAIHSYYTRILNCMPFLVYWVDENCKLQGFNSRFGKLLEIFSPEECKYEPYTLLTKKLKLQPNLAKELKLADMQVIFSGQPQHQQQLFTQKDNNNISYIINRDAILDDNGEVVGAVISITENKNLPINALKIKKTFRNKNSSQTPRVLIVEDNPTAQKVEEAIFTNLNCAVDSANNGEDALKLFKPGKYSLVIMDIGLEDSSGYLITRNFRELEKDTKYHTAIIALTSYRPDNVRDDCEFYKMEGVVAKPLTESQAKQIIERFVYNKKNCIDGFN